MSGTNPLAPAAPPDMRQRQLGRLRFASPARLPKTVLVTVGLTLLTAWLFPAFSRQWQDRQKARELTASLVAQVGRETSQTLVTSDFFSAGRTPFVTAGQFNQHLFNRLDLEWRTESSQIEAQVQAYYSAAVLDRWRMYARLVQKTYFLATPDMRQRATTLQQLRAHFGERNWSDWHARFLNRPWVEKPSAYTEILAYLRISDALLDEKSRLIDDMLNDHPVGFSTRPNDIVHDLVPFL